jgi:hypothetical protein
MEGVLELRDGHATGSTSIGNRKRFGHVQHLLALLQPFCLFLFVQLRCILWRHLALNDLLAKLLPKQNLPVPRDSSQTVDSNSRLRVFPLMAVAAPMNQLGYQHLPSDAGDVGFLSTQRFVWSFRTLPQPCLSERKKD